MTMQPDPIVAPSEVTDVVIVGGGLAGTLTARALVREGCGVTLIDVQAEPRPEFRAEQIVGPVFDKLAALGALPSIVGDRPSQPVTFDTRRGRVVARAVVRQLGMPYHAMVAGARAALPPEVRTVFGRVTGFGVVDGHQTAVLADGTRIAARLLVLATGLSTLLPKRLGFGYRTIRHNHSVTLGFDIAQQDGRALPPPIVQHPHSVRDKLGYLALFPMDGVLRANLFSYHDIASPWVRDFCHDPEARLEACMPGLDRLIGPYRITGPVQTRNNDLRVVDSPERDGVVLVGDAFQTPCPSVGAGMPRLISDAMTLARYVPDWLRTPDMGRAKIVRYYADPLKRAEDAEALRKANYLRALATDETLRWAVNRAKAKVRRRVQSAAGGLLRGVRAKASMAVAGTVSA